MKTFPVIARVKAPPGYVGLWLNIYNRGNGKYQSGGVYKKKSDADYVGKKYRYDCIYVHVKMPQ